MKRFQFNNGRWVKSQRRVHYPITGLEPKAYDDSINTIVPPLSHDRLSLSHDRQLSITPPINEEHDIQPLQVSVEIHNEFEQSVETKETIPDGEESSEKGEESIDNGCGSDHEEDQESKQPKEVESQSEEEPQSKGKGSQPDEPHSDCQSKEEEPQSEEEVPTVVEPVVEPDRFIYDLVAVTVSI